MGSPAHGPVGVSALRFFTHDRDGVASCLGVHVLGVGGTDTKGLVRYLGRLHHTDVMAGFVPVGLVLVPTLVVPAIDNLARRIGGQQVFVQPMLVQVPVLIGTGDACSGQ